MSLTKTSITEDSTTVWFCGCDINDEIARYDGYKDFGEHAEHEERFNADKLQKEYICHKTQMVIIEPYTKVKDI